MLHAQLTRAGVQLDLPLVNLIDSAKHAAGMVLEASENIHGYLEEHLKDDAVTNLGLHVVAFGSLAREESGPGSDFDYLVMATSMGVKPKLIQVFRHAAREAQKATGLEDPGKSKLFGVMVGSAELVNNIGLDEDMNRSLSRRVLLLQESVALGHKDMHTQLGRAVLARYLFDYEGVTEPLVPRFLLNDVLRYWRTVAVDYQAKRWDEMEGQKWGLRYIKLRSTRKWTFAGTVASLFMPVIERQNLTSNYLHRQFEMPALARLAQLSPYIPNGSDAEEALRETLRSADRIVGWLAQEDFRKSVAAVDSPRQANLPDEYISARSETVSLQQSLEALFFSTALLGDSGRSLGELSRKYLSF